jgi:uncharacterized protein YcnI
MAWESVEETFMSRVKSVVLMITLVALAPGSAFAHAVLETTDAKQNSVYKGVIELDHGCKGEATRAIHVTIPEGFIAAKPMPKAGWTLTIEKGPYAKPYPFKGGTLTEGAKTLTWQGNLPAEDYDEFIFQGFVTNSIPAGTTLYFPVVQDCETNTNRWTDIPVGAVVSASLAHPAPSIRIMNGSAAPNAVAIIDQLRVSQPWARPTAAGSTTAQGYFTVENRGHSPDRLIRVTSDAASSIAIVDARMDEDGLATTGTNGLSIAPGERLELRPGAYHLSLSDLKAPLKEGDTVKATIHFEKAGSLPIEFHVEDSHTLSSGSIMPMEDASDRM